MHTCIHGCSHTHPPLYVPFIHVVCDIDEFIRYYRALSRPNSTCSKTMWCRSSGSGELVLAWWESRVRRASTTGSMFLSGHTAICQIKWTGSSVWWQTISARFAQQTSSSCHLLRRELRERSERHLTFILVHVLFIIDLYIISYAYY